MQIRLPWYSSIRLLMQIRICWLASLLVLFALMVLLGSVPGQAESLSDRFGDKFLHMLAYTALSTLCYQSWRTSRSRRVALTVGCIALLGLIDESVQALLPYRQASLADWGVDLLAAALTVFVLSIFEMKKSVFKPDST